MQQVHNMRVSSQYIDVPQYLIDTKYPIETLFAPDEGQPVGGRLVKHKLGYSVTVKGGGFCSIRRLCIQKQPPSEWRDLASPNFPDAVTYSTDETLDFWKSGVRDGWESLYGGEAFTVRKDGVSFGFVHSDQIGIYLQLKGIKSRVIPLEHISHRADGTIENIDFIHVVNGNDFINTWGSYVGLCLLENKILPKNPSFAKRKRQIVTI